MIVRSIPPLPALQKSAPDVPALLPLHMVEHALAHRHQSGARRFVERQLEARVCWIAMHERVGCAERVEVLRGECAIILSGLREEDDGDVHDSVEAAGDECDLG